MTCGPRAASTPHTGHKQPQRGRHAPTRAHNGTSQSGLCTCARPSPPPVLIGPSCGLSWACSCQVEPRGPSQELLGAGSSWQEELSLPVSLEPEQDLTCSQSWGEPALCPHHPLGAGELSSGQSLEASLLGCCCCPGQGSTFTSSHLRSWSSPRCPQLPALLTQIRGHLDPVLQSAPPPPAAPQPGNGSGPAEHTVLLPPSRMARAGLGLPCRV